MADITKLFPGQSVWVFCNKKNERTGMIDTIPVELKIGEVNVEEGYVTASYKGLPSKKYEFQHIESMETALPYQPVGRMK